MNDNVRDSVLRQLARIAPEADLDQLQGHVGLRDQLDLDSVDFLNFIIALHKELHIDIPEKDYPKLMSLDGCVEYLRSKLPSQSR